MYSFYDLQEKIKSNFRFSGQEVKAILITILAAAFILTFRSWGDKTFNFNAGMINLFNAFLIVALSLIVKVSVQKIYALHIGYKFEYRLWFYGILAAIFLTFVSNGYLAVLALGGFIIEIFQVRDKLLFNRSYCPDGPSFKHCLGAVLQDVLIHE
jgi:chromate transport protein ChrA